MPGPSRREHSLNWRLYQQCKSLHGSLKGIAVVTALLAGKDTPPPLRDVLEALPDLPRPHHANDNWVEDIAKRMTAHGLGQW